MEAVLISKFFKAFRICDGVIRIVGMAGETCYLVEGTERALLIDGLSGVGSLKAFVRELTDMPVTPVITHGHLDHTGAVWEYEEAYISPLDVRLMYSEAHSSQKARLDFVKLFTSFGLKLRTEPMPADVLNAHAVKTYPLYEGDVFDLGETQIEAISVPGHTHGTMVFLDRKHRILFAGDACNSNTLLNLEGSTSVEVYLNSLRHFKTFQKDFDVIWSGHDGAGVPITIIDDGILLCEKILAGTDDAVPTEDLFGGKSYSASATDENKRFGYGGLCNILYKKETVREAI